MYIVTYWNAAGAACCSERMGYAAAAAFLGSMLPRQEAQLVYVRGEA